MRRTWSLLPAVIGIFGLAAAAVLAVLLQSDGRTDSTVLFSVPRGADGIAIDDGQADQAPRGPAAITVDEDGTVWIADTIAHRVLAFSSEGEPLARFELGGEATSIQDVAVRGTDVAVLDTYPTPPVILMLDRATGRVTDAVELPESWGLAGGLSGLSYGPDGQLLVEFEGGFRTARLADRSRGDAAIARGRPAAAGWFVAEPANPSADTRRASARYGSVAVEITSDRLLGAVSFLGEHGETFDLLVDELSQDADGVVEVERSVRRFDRSGRPVAIGRIPLEERYTFVMNDAVVTAAGDVLVLMPREDRVDAVRITLTTVSVSRD